ncbi:ABC transporter permease [Paenibacillus hodogayensis]|uniref:ABC transporter permease n=1 Tax=Paenibacillus hodogayensis TaxID=279208 RepID=A0ABV5VSN4_9BACL
MAVLIEFAKQSFKQRFIYRMNAYMMVASSFVGLIIMMSVWKALYSGKSSVGGITYEDMIHYVILNMLVQALIRSRIGQKVGERVENGAISIDLIRPVSFKGYFLADQFGENLFSFVFTTLPAVLAAMLVWGFSVPDSALRAALFAVSLLGGIVLMNQINYMFGMLAIWLKTAYFINFITGAVISLFAGSFVPLWFYPDILHTISMMLPFHLVGFQPIAIFLGKLSVQGAFLVIAAQAGWLVLLLAIERWMWNKAQAQLDIHGG